MMAVWSASSSKDSRVALYFFAVVMLLMVSPCLSDKRQPPWWTNSCNSTPTHNVCSSSESSPSFRHGRSTSEVKIQLDIFSINLKMNTRKINGFYRKITHDSARPNVTYRNLNLDNVIRQMRVKKKNRLLKFYLGLQRVAKLLDQAVGIKVNTTLGTYDLRPRYCALTEVLWSLRSLLCEVYETIQQKVRNPARALERHTVKGRGKRLGTLGMTDVFLRDISLLRKLEWFVRKSKKYFSANRPSRQQKH